MWYSKEIKEILESLGVEAKNGLSSEEAAIRLEKYGENKLKGKPPKSILKLFLSQLQDMLIYVLLGAAVITAVIGEYVDAGIILLVVVLNAAIGVFQEFKAEKAIEALAKMTTPKALVRRDGTLKEIASEYLVPGDILIIDAGRFIPADLRLIESANLQIEESALTGESVPSEKNASELIKDAKAPIGDQSNMAFMSTLATYGRGEGVVVATAMDTEMGKIAKILDEDSEDLTPLQQRLEELGKTLGYLAIGICILIFAVAVFQKRDLFEMFLTAISLAVAAIPEGLPAIVAIVLALGVTRMSKINAIVKKLPAVETLGSVNIICSDKTGTLTQNKMTVVKAFTHEGQKHVPMAKSGLEPSNEDRALIKALVLCSDATVENGESTGDPTEVALIVYGNQYGLTRSQLHAQYPRVGEFPFDSERKLMSTLNQNGNTYTVYTKGAIDHLLALTTHILVNGERKSLTPDIAKKFLKAAENMSNDALRVLGVAFKDTNELLSTEQMENNLTLIGIVGMIDPPREEVKHSILQAKGAGITPVMITGDHQNTAFAIAKELGIAEHMAQCLTGAEIDDMSEAAFAERVKSLRVFARVSPEHKVKIVKAFKAEGNIVSMTGDGVNDAPSLKNADIGVAMGITGTDVSKGAADMILTDDNFTTIVAAIKEGRNIYSNIKKAVVFLLSCNLGEVIAIFLSVVFFWPVPLIPTQILWINLITDTLPAIALGVDPGDKDAMKQKPRNPKESFFAQGAAFRAILGGVLIGLLTLTAFYFGIAEHGYHISDANIPEEVMTYARTMAFVVLAASQLFYSLTMRHPVKSILQVGLLTNKYLVGAIVIGLALQLSVISVPFMASAFKVHMISLYDWGLVFVFAMIPVTVNECIKWIVRVTGRE